MALVKCVECDRKISTLADSCPHCGAPVKHSIPEEEEETGHDRSGLILKLFLLLVALGLGYIFAKPQIDKYLGDMGGGSPADPKPKSKLTIGDKIRGGGKKTPEDNSKGTDVTKAIKASGEKEPEGKGSNDVMRNALGIGNEDPEKEPEKTPVKKPIVEIEPEPPVKPQEPVPDKKPPEKKPPVETAKPETGDEKPEPTKTEVPKKPETTAAVKAAGDARLKRVLARAEQEKIKIIDNLWIDEDGKLIVVVKKDWNIHSCAQREEIAAKIGGFWQDEKGGQAEFQTKEGEVVATENRSARYIKGKVKFRVKGCEK